MTRDIVVQSLAIFGLLVSVTSAQNYSQFAPPPPFYGYPAWISPYQPSTWNSTKNSTSFYNNSGYYKDYNAIALYAGYIWPNDRLLYNQTIEKQSRWWSSREKVIDYPGSLPLGHVRNDTITAIRVYDLQYNNRTGFAYILSGGVGYNFVRIKLQSSGIGRGFKFGVQIYGHLK